MLCGFGSVILLVMVVHASSVIKRERINQDLRAETDLLETQLIDAQKYLVELKNSLEDTEKETMTTQGLSREIIATLKEKQIELAELEEDTLAKTEHIKQLQADLKSLDEQSKRSEGQAKSNEDQGDKVRSFTGQGDRQYLTGLKMGGKRILFLVDTSASMLDSTIVNIIRLRNSSEPRRRNARKWRQAVKTVDWLTSQIPPTSQFQIYTFNETSQPVIQNTASKWLNATGANHLNDAVGQLKNIVPQKGTSLYRAFTSIKSMSPLPDNIFLLTDGLPTQGRSKASSNKITGQQRYSFFQNAIKILPSGIPLNVILFPIEGDPMAASAFWKLAISSRGSFLTPAEDWP